MLDPNRIGIATPALSGRMVAHPRQVGDREPSPGDLLPDGRTSTAGWGQGTLTGDLLPDGRTSTAGWEQGTLTGGFAPCGRTSTAGWEQGTLTGGFAPCGRTSPPAWRRALQKRKEKKDVRVNSHIHGRLGTGSTHRGICSLRSHIPARLAAGFAEEERKKGCASELTHPFFLSSSAVRGELKL